ncbi:hypothetical protein DPMN_007053 [Dreissena polymorpha]|uniref:Uncharacterized protein n=1 Tax=Dreissena polymorpha TaxID=45954 RepID=A0A9D4MVG4_DREPO|nr:hypothetical protein DPMN_007053 [Dreissena polymorpha]
MELRRQIELCACGTHRTTQVCQVSSLRHTYSKDNRAFRLLLWGNGANRGQLAYLHRHFHRKRWHRDAILNFAHA